MAKTKKSTSKNKGNNYVLLVSGLFIFLIALSGIMFMSALAKQSDTIGKYELIEKIDNQACRYLDRQISVNGGFDLNVDAPSGSPKLVYYCFNGERAAAREIQGKFVESYRFGATVSYFSSNQEAQEYAEQKVNPLRYWGVDEIGQRNNIPQTSRFTFIVNDERTPYFDAYTVKATAVLRVSLPCSDSDVANGGVACYAQASEVLSRELKGINVL